MNIDNLMDQLINQGVDFKSISKAYDDAADRKQKRDSKELEEARANVMQALRKYCTVLYGAVDDGIIAEFETTLKGLEKSTKKPDTFHMEMKSGDLDDEKLARFLKAISKF